MKNIMNVMFFIVIAIIVFLLVSQDFMYKFTQNITNSLGLTSSIEGKPNNYGLILHGVILALLLVIAGHFLLME